MIHEIYNRPLSQKCVYSNVLMVRIEIELIAISVCLYSFVEIPSTITIIVMK